MVSPRTTQAITTIILVLGCTESDREFKECSGHPEQHNQGEPRTDLGEEKGLEDDKKQGRDGDVTLDSDVSEPDQNKKKTTEN